MATLAEARGACRAVMFDDQLEAVESLIRAILRDPEGPGLPTVEPPEPGEEAAITDALFCVVNLEVKGEP